MQAQADLVKENESLVKSNGDLETFHLCQIYFKKIKPKIKYFGVYANVKELLYISKVNTVKFVPELLKEFKGLPVGVGLCAVAWTIGQIIHSLGFETSHGLFLLLGITALIGLASSVLSVLWILICAFNKEIDSSGYRTWENKKFIDEYRKRKFLKSFGISGKNYRGEEKEVLHLLHWVKMAYSSEILRGGSEGNYIKFVALNKNSPDYDSSVKSILDKSIELLAVLFNLEDKRGISDRKRILLEEFIEKEFNLPIETLMGKDKELLVGNEKKLLDLIASSK